MKTISKKFLQKLANKLDCKIVGSPNFIDIYGRLDDTHLGSILNKVCPELAEGEVLKPQPKWNYPEWDRKTVQDVWMVDKYNPFDKWRLVKDPNNGYSGYTCLPDPSNPNKPPKKNWRPE